MKFKKNNFIKIIICSLLFIGGIGLFNLPKTYSSFNDKDDNALVYKSQLYNLYGGEYTMVLEHATMDTAKLSISFKTNSSVSKDETDIYKISIPNSCTFISSDIITSGSGSIENSNLYTITFNPNSNRNDFNKLYINCSIEPNKNLNYTANISETIDEKEFIYMKYSYIESYKNYLNYVYDKVENSKVISGTSSNIYSQFIAWITEYAKSVGYEDTIVDYVRNTYPNEEALKNPNNYNALLGFSIQYDSVNNKYTYKILDNFVGYARTYKNCKGGFCSIESPYLYFSTTTKGGLYQALQNYLDKYIYPNNSEAANYIYNYVYDSNRFYDMIFNNAKINGLSLLKETTDIDNKKITVALDKTVILSSAVSFNKNAPYIALGPSNWMITAFGNGLTTYYSNYSLNIRRTIRNRSDIQSSITKNSTNVVNASSFKDYFIEKSGEDYLIIKVASDGSYNMFNITSISVSNNTLITFTNDDNNKLTINIKETTEDNAMKIVEVLDKYFGISTSINENNIISNTDTEYIIEYKINK